MTTEDIELVKSIESQNNWGELEILRKDEFMRLRLDAKKEGLINHRSGEPIVKLNISDRVIDFEIQKDCLSNSKNYNIDFSRCVFVSDIGFSDIELSNLSISQCYFLRNLNFNHLNVGHLSLIDNYAENRIQMYSIKAKSGNITGRYRGFSFSDWEIEYLKFDDYLEENLIEDLQIAGENSRGTIYFDKFCIRDMRLFGKLSEGVSLIFNECKVCRLGFVKFINSGLLSMSNLEVSSAIWFEKIRNKQQEESASSNPKLISTRLTITESDLSGVIFQNVNFNVFEKILIQASLLTKAVFIECELKELSKRIISEYDTSSMSKHEISRQIKSSFINQNDQVNADFFRQQELSEFFYSYKGPKFSSLYAILLLSNWGSKFGTSIGRPLLLLMLSTLMFSSVLIYFEALPLFETENVKPDLFSRIVQFGNPIRSFEPYQSGWFTVMDLLLRIINGYCIYNFLRATRRFVK